MSIETVLSLNNNSIAKCKHNHKADGIYHTKTCYANYGATCFICNCGVSNPLFELYFVKNSDDFQLLYHSACAEEVGFKGVNEVRNSTSGANIITMLSDKIISKCEDCNTTTSSRYLTSVIRNNKKIFICDRDFGDNKCFVCYKIDYDRTTVKYVEIKTTYKTLYHHTTCNANYCPVCSGVIYDGNWIETMIQSEIVGGRILMKVHLKCHDDVKCVKCGTRAGKDAINVNHSLSHRNCLPNNCNICQKAIGPHEWKEIGNNVNKSVQVHKSCAEILVCFICSAKGGDIVYEKEMLRHRGCVNDICRLCNKIIGPDSCEDIGDKTKYHLKCLKTTRCYVCDTLGGDLKYGIGGIHHKQVCTRDICPVCADIIGPAPFSKINDETYHTACVDEIKCYACGESGKGKKIIDINRHDFENRFIHDKCSSAKCTECDLFIGAAPIRVVCGKFYHGGIMPHGPKCHICKEFTSDDFVNLIPINGDKDTKYTPKKYCHATCSKDECIVCLKSLGKIDNRCFVTPDGKIYKESKEEISQNGSACTYSCHYCGKCRVAPKESQPIESENKVRKIEVHSGCIDACGYCREIYVDYNDMFSTKNTHISIVVENWKHLPLYFQEIVISTWLSIRNVAPYIDKNIIKKLIVLTLSEIPDIEKMLPIKRGIFDFNKICTPARCVNNSCKCVCGKDFTWDVENRMKCSAKRCIYAVKAFQDIMSIAYKKQQHFTWPGTEEQGIKAATLAIIDAQPQDSVICDVKFRAVERLLSGRKK